jgi:hypothetical protein
MTQGKSKLSIVTWLMIFGLPIGFAAALYKLASFGLVQLSLKVTPDVVTKTWTRLALSALLLGGGYGLARLRAKARLFYSLVEIAFGIASNWYSLRNIATLPADLQVGGLGRLAVFGGGMYLIGRGFANLLEATAAPQADPALKFILDVYDFLIGLGAALFENGLAATWPRIKRDLKSLRPRPIRKDAPK